MEAEGDIGAEILHKLAKHRLWGKKHADLEHLKNSFKPHLRGKVFEVAKGLIKENLLVRKPASYGLQVSLNFGMRDRIYAIIDAHLKRKI